MNIQMGSQIFENVTVPILWGSRAVIQDSEQALSLIDLAGKTARLEILADSPAPGVEFTPELDGFTIRSEDVELYRLKLSERKLVALAWNLPDVQLSPSGMWIGSNFIGDSTLSGFGVGISVQEDGITIGGPLPPNLAALAV